MRKNTRKYLYVTLFLLVLTAIPAFGANQVGRTIEKSLKDALVKTGMQNTLAVKMSQRFLFMGTVMIRNVPPATLEGEEDLLAQAKRNGEALGIALGNSHKVYKDEKLQETAAMMMHAVRAGLLPETAAETFSAFALHGYAFDASAALVHEAAEAVRTSRFSDSGVELCRQLRKMVSEKEPVQEMKKQVLVAVRREQAKQKELLAQKQKEREVRESRYNDESGSKEPTAVASKPGASSVTSSGSPSSARASKQKTRAFASSKAPSAGTTGTAGAASSSGTSNTAGTGNTATQTGSNGNANASSSGQQGTNETANNETTSAGNASSPSGSSASSGNNDSPAGASDGAKTSDSASTSSGTDADSSSPSNAAAPDRSDTAQQKETSSTSTSDTTAAQ